MSKKMRIPSIFKNKEAKQLWQWPSCTQPETLSFRASKDNAVFKTVNSMFLDVETPESLFTNSSESPSFSTDQEFCEENDNHPAAGSDESLEMIIRGVKSSERLFFEPGETKSIMKETKTNSASDGVLPFKESVAMALESDDPYSDFKKSMKEMVESHGVKDWEGLEELLGWYLRMNGKMNHGFIVGAFLDLLIEFTNSPSSSSSTKNCPDEYKNSARYSSAASSFSSSSSSPRSSTGEIGHEIVIDHED